METNETALHAHWIHTRVESEQSVNGYFLLPECHCSNCGTTVNFEREVCPHCHAKMDEEHE